MKSRSIVLSILILFPVFVSCVEEDALIVDGDPQELMNEIIELSESISCVDSGNWAYTAIGSKPCGGPTGYLAYSLDIDTENFLSKVEAHRIAQYNNNIKLGLVSDCSVPAEPTAIECVDGQPQLVYEKLDK